MSEPRETLKINTDVKSETLRGTFLNKIPAHGGTYVNQGGGSWIFVLDPLTRVRLFLKGVKAPEFVPADKLVAWRTVPTHPLVGGFTHPLDGNHTRSAAIPVEWDVALHGRPGLTFRGGYGNLLGDLDKETPMTPIQKAQKLARRINENLGVLAGKAMPWWLYTLPGVTDTGAPIVTLGIKGDYQPDAKEIAALPWLEWRKHGVVIRVEYVPPKGSNIPSTFAVIQPQGAPPSMGSAPVDTVWPTSSPDYHEPTGPATGDFDAGMGMCCGMGDMGQSSHGFPLRWRDPSQYALQPPTDRWVPARLSLRDRLCQQPFPPGPPGDAADEGMGSAPIVAMPTGMLNWDRVTGYEGQPWVTRDWSGQHFMGDVGPSGPAAPASKKAMVGGILGAVAGGAAAFLASSKWFAPQGRVSAETPVIAGATTAGAVGGMLAANAIVGWLES